MPKAYDPKATEARLYNWWEQHGWFKPETGRDQHKPPFVISMPPPNVTGALHIGHAMTAAVEDLLIRWHRMTGEPTLWVPGSDHAGIATQNVVERMLLAEEEITRHDLGREQFVARVWQWKQKYGARITEQHRRLGASCDWERERFTLDEGLSYAVRTAFVQLYHKGLIYRGTYLVNWCPRCESAISDLEVIYWQEKGHLWTVRYPLEPTGQLSTPPTGQADSISVATTRPETILGDTAVAVNPNDPRYQALIGRTAVLPVLGRRIPIIADESVDMAFGTGAVKVTPGHDPNDYAIAQRHKLAAINILNDNGTLNENAGPFVGQDRLEARKGMVHRLEIDGLLVKTEAYAHDVGHCQRCDTIIEPRLSTQWFIRIKPLAEPAIAAVREGRIRIIPERFNKVYFNWMENIRDWCISRQLWWGHRIPVWYCDDCGRQTCTLTDPTACAHCGSARIHQDEDVLDTWFSSALWPFSTLGWPTDTPDLRRFYPTSVMETGYDILFFWVARMIMMGLECTGTIPFHTVYLHGLVRDEFGRKYSKSLGNALDPVEVIEEYGTDALRYALVTSSTPGNDTKLAERFVEAGRNFANKIWNAGRLIMTNLDQEQPARVWQDLTRLEGLTLADRWIISRYNGLVTTVNQLLTDYQLGEAGRQIQDFFWGEFCDWYLEIAKQQLKEKSHRANTQAIMVQVMEGTLRLLHPFMPFVTEEVWQRLTAGQQGPALIIAEYPQPGGAVDTAAERDMGKVIDLVREIRNVRAEFKVTPGLPITALIAGGNALPLLQNQRQTLVTLAHLDPAKLHLAEYLPEKPHQAIAIVQGELECYLPLAGLVDLEAETVRLDQEIAQAETEISRTQALLAKPGFVEKAKPEVVEKERAKLAETKVRLEKLRARRAMLSQ